MLSPKGPWQEFYCFKEMQRFDCPIYDNFFINKLRPSLNVQCDSIRAKCFCFNALIGFTVQLLEPRPPDKIFSKFNEKNVRVNFGIILQQVIHNDHKSVAFVMYTT